MLKIKNNKKFYLWAAASLLCMTAIFYFSSHNAEESGELSSSLTYKLFKDGAFMETLEVLVRKTAHVIIFAALSFCTANTVRQVTQNKRYIFIISVTWCSFYAATDEWHQYFVPGRACMWQDWVIDTLGVLLGIGAAFFIMRVADRHKLLKSA